MTRPLLAMYGDDFTGSSASMEVLAFAGIPTIMFLQTPSKAQLERFSDKRAFGIAGIARSKSPQWMADELPKAFKCLAGLNAEVTHYKVCSTFDSAPTVGSIGKAIDIAVPILGGDWHPLLVAAPAISRFQLFGNLFAAVEGRGYRLDRHPTMARHPITPMNEADICQHLAKQTDRRIELIDFLQLRGNPKPPQNGEITAIDCLDDASLVSAGQMIWENRGKKLFAIGSQGIEYALVAHWRQIGLIEKTPNRVAAQPAPIAAVSGSCSPVTAKQIERAIADGFAPIELDAACVVSREAWGLAIDKAFHDAKAAFELGRNPLIFTARGPRDPSLQRYNDALAKSGLDAIDCNQRVGSGLGQILKNLVQVCDVGRLAIAGGDTSGHALNELGIVALQARTELAPACAISCAYSDDPRMDGIEVALKGGQMGPIDYFNMVASAKPAATEVT